MEALDHEPPASAVDAKTSREFKDSTELIGEARELRSRFAEDGYLFFRGVLDRKLVEAARAEILAGFHMLGWTRSRDDSLPVGRFATYLGRKDFWPGMIRMLETAELHMLAFDQTLGHILADLYGRDYFAHPRRLPRIKFPAATNGWSESFAHQDFPYIQGSLDTVTVWMPLGDCARREGALEILAGSHRHGVIPIISGPKYPCTVARVDNDAPGWHGGDFQIGDIALFSSLTVHRARPNGSDRVRISVDCRFQPICEPVCESAFAPGYSPNVPPWSELLGADRSSLYEVPDGLRSVPFERPGLGSKAPAANTCFPWLLGDSRSSDEDL